MWCACEGLGGNIEKQGHGGGGEAHSDLCSKSQDTGRGGVEHKTHYVQTHGLLLKQLAGQLMMLLLEEPQGHYEILSLQADAAAGGGWCWVSEDTPPARSS